LTEPIFFVIASVKDIDKACVYGLGHPLGPFIGLVQNLRYGIPFAKIGSSKDTGVHAYQGALIAFYYEGKRP
jgi:hypothetical protein